MILFFYHIMKVFLNADINNYFTGRGKCISAHCKFKIVQLFWTIICTTKFFFKNASQSSSNVYFLELFVIVKNSNTVYIFKKKGVIR